MEFILQTILTTVYGLIGIGIIILVHELGHFFLAKKFGVKVETFSIGFGFPILKFKKGETVYQIGCIPLGGYCKLAGEEINRFVPPASDEFYAKPPLQRLGIVFAGPFMNYLLGLILFTAIFLIGIKRSTYDNKIIVLDKITLRDKKITTPAKKAGLKDGDIIIKIDEKKVDNWRQIQDEIIIAGDEVYKKITVKRKGRALSFKVKPVVLPSTGGSVIGIIPYISNEIEKVVTNSPAFKAGIKTGDKVIQIDNKRISNFRDIKFYTINNPGKIVRIKVLRNGRVLNYRIKLGNINGRGFLGALFKSSVIEYVDKARNLFDGIYKGFLRANRTVKNVLYSFRIMFTGRVIKRKAVSGPVKLIYLTGKATQEGGVPVFLLFIGFISIAIAFINLLPIPAVDGSYIIIFFVEFIIHRKINYNVIKIVQRVGLVLIIIIAAIVIGNDIRSLIVPDKTVSPNPFISVMS